MENGELCVILDSIAMQLLLCADSLDTAMGLPPLEPPGVYSLLLMISSNMCTYFVFLYYSAMVVLLDVCG